MSALRCLNSGATVCIQNSSRLIDMNEMSSMVGRLTSTVAWEGWGGRTCECAMSTPSHIGWGSCWASFCGGWSAQPDSMWSAQPQRIPTEFLECRTPEYGMRKTENRSSSLKTTVSAAGIAPNILDSRTYSWFLGSRLGLVRFVTHSASQLVGLCWSANRSVSQSEPLSTDPPTQSIRQSVGLSKARIQSVRQSICPQPC